MGLIFCNLFISNTGTKTIIKHNLVLSVETIITDKNKLLLSIALAINNKDRVQVSN